MLDLVPAWECSLSGTQGVEEQTDQTLERGGQIPFQRRKPGAANPP